METPAKLTCVLVKASTSYTGKQGFSYFEGISRQTVGAEGLCMHLLRIPPGGRATPHYHERHETAIYVLDGECDMWYGEGLQEHMLTQTGDFVYIPAGVPHLPANHSQERPCVAVLARTDPNEQESVVLLPESLVPASLRSRT